MRTNRIQQGQAANWQKAKSKESATYKKFKSTFYKLLEFSQNTVFQVQKMRSH